MAIEHGGNGSWRKRKLENFLEKDKLSSGQLPGCLFYVLWWDTGIDRCFLQEGLLITIDRISVLESLKSGISLGSWRKKWKVLFSF